MFWPLSCGLSTLTQIIFFFNVDIMYGTLQDVLYIYIYIYIYMYICIYVYILYVYIYI